MKNKPKAFFFAPVPKSENPALKPVSRFDDLMCAVVKVKLENKKKSAERKK
jgi:hypothetical protein